MHHIYLRVSTDHQDTNSQRTGILEHLAARKITEYTETPDTVSGACPWRSRLLAPLLNQAQPGDTIVVSEVSRISRSISDCLEFFHAASTRQISVYVVKSALTVDGSLASKITTTVLALAAEIERELMLARSKEGLARARAAGVHCGRPPGSTSVSKCAQHHDQIARLLKKNVPIATIARIIDCNRATLTRYIARQQTAA